MRRRVREGGDNANRKPIVCRIDLEVSVHEEGILNRTISSALYRQR